MSKFIQVEYGGDRILLNVDDIVAISEGWLDEDMPINKILLRSGEKAVTTTKYDYIVRRIKEAEKE